METFRADTFCKSEPSYTFNSKIREDDKGERCDLISQALKEIKKNRYLLVKKGNDN